MQNAYQHTALRRLFAGLVEQAFAVEVGICDPRLAEYLVMLLVDFVHVDRLYRIRDARGRRLESIAEMLNSLESQRGSDERTRRREVHRHIGDFALFWAGVFPEGLRRRGMRVHPDTLLDYVGRGKQSYAIAATLHREDSVPPGSLLRRLSEEFELCAHGLGLVRRGWEQQESDGGEDPRHLLY